jgi:colanic acid/amylovoran biosynthesis protein
MQKILIVNLHSALNLGDDAIMQATLAGLHERYPQAQITAAANHADSWRKYREIVCLDSLATWFGDPQQGQWRRSPWRFPYYTLLLLWVALAYRWWAVRFCFGTPQQRALLTAYYEADLVLSCGGGNFYAERPLSPAFLVALFTIALPLLLNKPVVMLPQSLGPIVGRGQHWLARQVFQRIPLIMLREERSQQFLNKTLRINPNSILIPDLAFGLPVVAPHLPTPKPEQPHVLRIGITPLDRGAQQGHFQRQQQVEEMLVALVAQVAREEPCRVYLFVQCYGPSPDQDDRSVVTRLQQKLQSVTQEIIVLDQFHDALTIKAAYQAMHLVIAMRMHAGIFALSSGVPVVLLGYQPKSCGMLALAGLPQLCLDLEVVTYAEIWQVVEKILRQRLEMQVAISEKYAQTLAQQQQWLTQLATLGL